jgi:hypothetical protein
MSFDRFTPSYGLSRSLCERRNYKKPARRAGGPDTGGSPLTLAYKKLARRAGGPGTGASPMALAYKYFCFPQEGFAHLYAGRLLALSVSPGSEQALAEQGHTQAPLTFIPLLIYLPLISELVL